MFKKKTNLTFKYCSSPTSVTIKSQNIINFIITYSEFSIRPSKTYQKYVQANNGGLLKNTPKTIDDHSTMKYKNIFSQNSQSNDQFSRSN